MKRLVIVPNNLGSRSAKALAEVLSEKVGHKVFRVPAERVGKRIPFVLREGTDKLTQLQRFHDQAVPSPDFTTAVDAALRWLADGSAVVCRTLLRGSEGRGIVVAETPEQIVPAPLYTRYTKKKREYRVHVFNGQVIDVQEKRRRKEFDGERDSRIRNVDNGYVFCRNGITEPAGLREIAVAATTALRYNLGAVDVGYNERDNRCFVFEVNSTPGMEGTTLQNYSQAITQWWKEQNDLSR